MVVCSTVLVAALIAPAFGGPSLKKLVKKEVQKQIGKAKGPAGPPGASGANGSARAFGRTDQDGVITNQQNVIGNADTGATGIYCITLDPSVDASTANVLVTPDFAEDDTQVAGVISHAEWRSDRFDCPGGGNIIEVVTYRVDLDNDVKTLAEEGFSFMVP